MTLATARLAGYADRTAIVCGAGQTTYGQLDAASARVAAALLEGGADLEEARVAVLARPGRDYVDALMGIWRAGGVAVPLCVSHPRPELEYVLNDSGAALVLADRAMAGPALEVADAAGARVLTLASALS
ncbi:AMP-binding protein, partial [Candidatus Poribacteria bacterium]|nr:AMP-binding protein [Candidatus Poribacteria bacterium]